MTRGRRPNASASPHPNARSRRSQTHFRAAAPLGLLALFAATTVARAAELAPAQPYRYEFRGGASVTVSYTVAGDGFRVVATMQSDDTDHQTVSRVVATLRPGQSAFLSVPSGAGSRIDTLAIVRDGDALSVIEAPIATTHL